MNIIKHRFTETIHDQFDIKDKLYEYNGEFPVKFDTYEREGTMPSYEIVFENKNEMKTFYDGMVYGMGLMHRLLKAKGQI